MKTTLSLFVLAALLNVDLVGGTYASDDMVAAGSQTLKGDVLKIEGEYYVLKDPTGMEVRLHVDKTSQLEGEVKAGDKIEAQVTRNGHAESIKRNHQ